MIRGVVVKGYSSVQETARRWGISIRWMNQYALEGRLPGAEHCKAWTRWEWLKTLAIPEHGLLWTLIVCPIAGLAVAGLNMLI